MNGLYEESIRKFITENFFFGVDDAIVYENDDSFMKNGIIDSTGVLELIIFIEETFGVKVADDEITQDNLDSINNIIGFLDRKIPKLANNESQ